jgi:hypothetical protein
MFAMRKSDVIEVSKDLMLAASQVFFNVIWGTALSYLL